VKIRKAGRTRHFSHGISRHDVFTLCDRTLW